MLTAESRIRICPTALAKAGRYGIGRALNKGERLTQVLKYMAEHSALASGRKRDGFTHQQPGQRRRYGDVVLVLRGGTVVDLALARPDYCRTCFGTRCTSMCH